MMEVDCNMSRLDNILLRMPPTSGQRGWREIKARVGIPTCYCCVAVRDYSVVIEFHVHSVGKCRGERG